MGLNILDLIMKIFIVLAAFLSLASSGWTCYECQAVVKALAKDLTSEQSIQDQVNLLLAEVCPVAEDVDQCVEQLPEFWTKIAMTLWPLYYNPDEDFMCGVWTICGPSTRTVTCKQCLSGVRATMDQLLSEDFVSGIVYWLSGEGFCGAEEDPELCAKTIEDLIPAALSVFYAAGVADEGYGPMICNEAIPDTCPANP